MDEDVIIEEQPEQSRYVARRRDGGMAARWGGGEQGEERPFGFLTIEARGEDRVAFTHTVTDPAMRGRGIASALVARAVRDARERGQTVLPECSYAAAWFERHEEERDLLG